VLSVADDVSTVNDGSSIDNNPNEGEGAY